jgi:redox-sensitive bicupin YhaK (pirin superfamily)
LPAAAAPETVRVLYVFEGAGVTVDGEEIGVTTGAVVTCDVPHELVAADDVELLILQGRPIGEPVAQYGPFVMNNRAEIQQAFEDYQRTGFGGWPWPSHEPVNPPDAGRFARRPDGAVEQPA